MLMLISTHAFTDRNTAYANVINAAVIRIAELEATVQLLTASHLAILRAVGELGGFSKWAKFYEQYRDARDKLSFLNVRFGHAMRM